MRLFATALALAALAGCYDTPRPACAFACGPEGACPAGYTCREDGWCKRADVPDDTACALATVDAAPLADAGPDAAPADAAVIDAGVADAGVPDASLPDAALPDAALPDAAAPLPDAAPPDAAAALPDASI